MCTGQDPGAVARSAMLLSVRSFGALLTSDVPPNGMVTRIARHLDAHFLEIRRDVLVPPARAQDAQDHGPAWRRFDDPVRSITRYVDEVPLHPVASSRQAPVSLLRIPPDDQVAKLRIRLKNRRPRAFLA